jgi:hypothetical protein
VSCDSCGKADAQISVAAIISTFPSATYKVFMYHSHFCSSFHVASALNWSCGFIYYFYIEIIDAHVGRLISTENRICVGMCHI